MPDYGPSLTACKLWAKTSAKGVQYFTGRMGGLRVTILPNRDKTSDTDASHVMLFGEAAAWDPTKAQPSSDTHQAEPEQRQHDAPGDDRWASPAPRPAPARAWSNPNTRGRGGPKRQLPEDAVPF
jgi:hypothetical protein